MTRTLFTISLLCLTLTSCGQVKISNEINGLVIDKNIKIEVEKYIKKSKEFDGLGEKIQVYDNSLFAEVYENDSLIFKTNNGTNRQVFKSFYIWKGDTLIVDGAFGLFTGIGFEININHNKATLYHLLSSDEIPSYAYKKNDSLIFRLEVPCTDTKIVLSEIPDSTQRQIIYGYVEFKSSNYYESSGTINGKEESPRKKHRDNMKIYFSSGKLDL